MYVHKIYEYPLKLGPKFLLLRLDKRAVAKNFSAGKYMKKVKKKKKKIGRKFFDKVARFAWSDIQEILPKSLCRNLGQIILFMIYIILVSFENFKPIFYMDILRQTTFILKRSCQVVKILNMLNYPQGFQACI